MSPSCGTGETIRLSRVSVRDLESTQWLDISSSVWVCNALSSDGFDAPICQDSRSRSQVCGLARSVVCHHALKNLAGEKACETADDLPFGPPFSGASFDVVEGW